MISNISSLQNPLIKHIAKLRDNVNYRMAQKQAVIYGEHLIVEAIKAGNLVAIVLLEGYNPNSLLSELVNKANKPVYLLTNKVMLKVIAKAMHVDIAGIIEFTPGTLNNNIYQQDCIILENIQDPGNLGTILRSCCASGINNVILSKDSVDVYNYKVLRSSQGVQFQLNIITDIILEDFIANYQGQLYATVPSTDASLYNECLTKYQSIGFVFGNEGLGLSNKLLSKLTKYVRIPMTNSVESLNVAMCATLCMFELYRQRISI